MTNKKKEFANKDYCIRHNDFVNGIIYSQEEECAIGHLIETQEIFVPAPGMVFDDGVKDYVIIEVNSYNLEDIEGMLGCITLMNDFKNLRNNKVIKLANTFLFVEVMDANFGYL